MQEVTRATAASRFALASAIVLVMVLAAAPYWGSTASLRLLGEIMVYLALASLWNLLAGFTGLVSIGQQAYVGFGGYMLFTICISLGWNPLYAIPIAALVAAPISALVAVLVFRLNGAYFAIGTWVVAEVFRLGFAQMSSLGGGSGLSLPITVMREMASTKAEREALIYWAALLLGTGSITIVYLLLRSRIGLALTAIRDSEVASSSLGVSITRVKLLVYVAVAAATAMVGALVFMQKLRIAPNAAFSVTDWTAFVIFMVVIGGIGTIEGPIIGTLLYFVLRQFLADFGSIYLIVLGGLAILVMMVAPQGIWGFVANRWGLSLFPVGYRVKLQAMPAYNNGKENEYVGRNQAHRDVAAARRNR
ncbi:branched-chain amino acid ABC transporter permease [Bradyrhizobium sp. Ec3.3]|uniref:branched-chain amino acid ABC transporter permease n=1 Tax=Bradyrhizobium sp. Ec3.3 TaxID=189753 RepID=UPI0007C52A0A|nr:branched-chain amino acid ABC transporter permease [Bradyrhizobium sp. Ec3.3]